MLTRLTPLVLAVALVAAACGDDSPTTLDAGPAADIYGGECADDTGSEVTIYSGRSENLMEPVIEAFICETGIQAQVKYGDNAELALLMSEEGDRTPADVLRVPVMAGFLEPEGVHPEHVGIAGDTLVPGGNGTGQSVAQHPSVADIEVGEVPELQGKAVVGMVDADVRETCGGIVKIAVEPCTDRADQATFPLVGGSG